MNVETDTIVRMANQIASFFGALPRDEALAGFAGHIRDFWDPRMREHLRAHLAVGGDGLSPLVIEAMTLDEDSTV